MCMSRVKQQQCERLLAIRKRESMHKQVHKRARVVRRVKRFGPRDVAVPPDKFVSRVEFVSRQRRVTVTCCVSERGKAKRVRFDALPWEWSARASKESVSVAARFVPGGAKPLFFDELPWELSDRVPRLLCPRGLV